MGIAGEPGRVVLLTRAPPPLVLGKKPISVYDIPFTCGNFVMTLPIATGPDDWERVLYLL